MNNINHFVKNFFKDKHGKVVIGQTPNRSLILAVIFYAFRYTEIRFLVFIGEVGFIVSITYWAYLEMFYGVNSWRKLLGTIVMFSAIASMLGKMSL